MTAGADTVTRDEEARPPHLISVSSIPGSVHDVQANAKGEQADHVPLAPRISDKAVSASSEAQSEDVAGDPNRIRTCNPRSRNPLLYPVELWDRRFRPRVRPPGLHSIANMKKSASGQAISEPFPAAKRPTGTVDRCVRSALNAMFAPQITHRRRKGHASAMSCEILDPLFPRQFPSQVPRHESVTFSRTSVRNAADVRAQGAPS